MSDRARPRPVIFGCAGERLGTAERRFFAEADPLGFILFRRNCREPGQVRDLVASLRDCVGRADAPVLIDQEGGRVARLGPPHWRRHPAAAELAREGEAAVFGTARQIAADLAGLGITVDCAPVLDLRIAGADQVIGDRSFGADPAAVARFGRAWCDGLLAGGVLPVLKHIPGHGRARADSHVACPAVDAAADELAASDFAPFRALAEMPWAMTAHVVYTAFDPDAPATLSSSVIGGAIRGTIGFDGVLISDDLSMGALSGPLGARAAAALAAGCDLALHCSGRLAEMEEIAAATGPLAAATAARLARGEAMRRRSGAAT